MKGQVTCDFCGKELQFGTNDPRSKLGENVGVFWEQGTKAHAFDACDECAEKIYDFIEFGKVKS